MDGTLVDPAEARVSVYDHGLLYGDGVFEGLRAYGGRVFKLDSHLKRLEASAACIRLAIPYTRAQLAEAVRDTVAACGMPDCYIRLLVTRGPGSLGLNPFSCPRAGVVVIADTIQLYPPELYRTGMKVVVAKRPRIPIECLDPAIKSLNYLNNVLAKREATVRGADDALVLNARGLIAESSATNVFALTGQTLDTPPTTDGALEGLTRRTVMELAPEHGLTVRERSLGRFDLYAADAVFLTGTRAGIVPVGSLDGTPIATVGWPILRALSAAFDRRAVELSTPVA